MLHPSERGRPSSPSAPAASPLLDSGLLQQGHRERGRKRLFLLRGSVLIPSVRSQRSCSSLPSLSMDTWRRGSIKSTTFFRRFSLRRHKKLGNQVIILNQNSHTLDTDGQKRECLRDKSEYLSCQSEQNLAKAQAPPKPPRLYLDSSSCPNIIDHTDSHSDLSFSDSAPYHKATPTHKDQATEHGTSEAGLPNSTTLPDLADPFLSFKVDLGLSLLEDVLQTLRKQNPRDYAI
ncbi:uncharacterized protein C15orf62 homolog, mitochondrial isoform X1 [Catharus ustulatus]|uniref:uncharacterized protein C15orf62 homolog, mitochondrial isoform X1 n=2 Tax=Catharus ustulatus TaxID=91951 RepID=UPI00140C16B5|nr:uncharacterized protein C15orf62 homolog, mitochondrial isoform X1 [Catharus ustulatus]